MGAFLDKPKVEKHNEGGRGNGVRYGLSSMQGWRVEMEDAHCAAIGLPHGLDEWSFFAVFDGHAGDGVSAYCSSELIRCIIQNPDFLGSENQNSSICANPSPDNVQQGIRTGFLNLDDKLRNMPNVLNGKDKSGSTATSVCITPDQFFFANCGDSRATLTRAGKVFYSTQDHKPMNPAEKERIQNAGGSVMIQRVNGSLAVSRALGDFEYKNVKDRGPCEQLVSPEPEICAKERSLDDEFIVLACDGVWDVMTNEELSEFITSRLKITDNLEGICNQVVDTCLHKGSRDNMSIVIVCFDGAPKVSSEAILAEEELNARIETKVKEILEDAEVSPRGVPTLETDVRCVITALSGQEISGLPPGGGLMSKYPLVESLVNKLGVKHTQDQPVVRDDKKLTSTDPTDSWS